METSNAVVPPEDPAVGRAVTVLLEMYKENTNHGRHLETQRQLVTGFIVAIATAALAALSTLKFAIEACVGLGSVLIVFGGLGTAFSVVQYGKYTQSRARWGAARELLALKCPSANLGAIRAASEAKSYTPDPKASQRQKRESRRMRTWLKIGHLPLHWLWTLLMLIVFILGLILVVDAAKLSSWAHS